MRARFNAINRDLIRVQRELQERNRLLDEIERADAQRIVLTRDVARMNERTARLREQINQLRRKSNTSPNWLEKIRHARSEIENIERAVGRESAEIRFINNRIDEYENRLIDLADSDSELAMLREEQVELLSAWANNFQSVFNPIDLSDFTELLATIADAEDHILELDEAIVFGEKALNALRDLLEQVWHVWRAPNDYRLGWEIDKITGLVASAESRLSWFHRELWDVDRQFDEQPVIFQRIAFFDDIHHHEAAQPAPRIDPNPIEAFSQEVRDKLYRLRDELAQTVQLKRELEKRREKMVDELWSERVFRMS